MKLLYYSFSSTGGIAEYAHAQANALAEAGVDVTLLCSPEFYPSRKGARYRVLPALRELAPSRPLPVRALRAARVAGVLMANAATLGRTVRRHGFRHVLCGTYFEHLAPLWAGPLRRLARRGVTFGAVLHDPVREFQYAVSRRWHRWSVAAGYSYLREVFVHEEEHLAHVPPREGLRATVVPQGIYPAAAPGRPAAEVRAELGIPPGAPVLLAFGSIRDNKNLDLVIRALAEFPELYLLVAGERISRGDRPPSFYQQLAEEVGVAGRCRWRIGFVPDEEVGDYFAAADLALITYSGRFVSASAVAGTAARYRKPFLASSGGGWLRSVSERYGVGLWVEPDSLEAVVEGLRRWRTAPPEPDWERFAAEQSWRRNAELVIERLWSRPPGLTGGSAAE